MKLPPGCRLCFDISSGESRAAGQQGSRSKCPSGFFGIEFEAEEVGIARQSGCRLGVDRPCRDGG